MSHKRTSTRMAGSWHGLAALSVLTLLSCGDGSSPNGAPGEPSSNPPSVAQLAQLAYLKASNTAGGNEFGVSVAIDGDTLVVGAFREDSNATGVNGNQADKSAVDSGAVYVFVRNGATWMQQAYLKASNSGAGDEFGVSVAILGNTIVVGAPRERSTATGINGDQADNEAPFSGAAYVFTRSGTVWSQQAYLKPSNTNAVDFFGTSVAISRDTLVVGSPGEDSSATGVNGNQADNSAVGSGAAYVFSRNGATWTQQAYLKATNAQTNDQFGASVAVSGDVLVVGAPGEDSAGTGSSGQQGDNSAPESGAAYVFVRIGATWLPHAYLKASNTDPGDRFGTSVAVSNGTLVVGAPFERSLARGIDGDQADNNTFPRDGTGAVYVFTHNGVAWVQQVYVKPSNSGFTARFGNSLALAEDTLIVGAFLEASNAIGVNGDQLNLLAEGSGAAYLFSRVGTAWSQQAYLKSSNTARNNNFGFSVAISEGTAVSGAFGESSSATGVNGDQADNSAVSAGAVYVF